MLNLNTEIKLFRLDRPVPASKTPVNSFSSAMNVTWDSDNHLMTPIAVGVRGSATAAAQGELGFQTAVGSNRVVEMPKAGVIELLSIGLLACWDRWPAGTERSTWASGSFQRYRGKDFVKPCDHVHLLRSGTAIYAVAAGSGTDSCEPRNFCLTSWRLNQRASVLTFPLPDETIYS